MASSLNAVYNVDHLATASAIDSALAREIIVYTLTNLTLRDEVSLLLVFVFSECYSLYYSFHPNFVIF